jgi:hypothetical protein
MSIELFPLNLLIPAEGENDYVSQCRAWGGGRAINQANIKIIS